MNQPNVPKGMVNGVNVDQLFATVDAIKGNSEIAKFRFQVMNEWVNGGHNHIKISEFFGAQQNHRHDKTFELDADEHQILLGEDKGPNPVEYLLTALSGCLTSSLIYHASAKGIKIKGLQSRIEGDLDLRGFLGLSPDIKVGYENIRVFFKIDADVSEPQKQELIELAQKYSPVFNTIKEPTHISVSLDKT